MTYEKHTTHTDALDTLGSIIGPEEKRDAIHLAVDPAIAGGTLRPGDHVFLENGRAFYAIAGGSGAVGIVDPFLTRSVREGEYFWLVVYPRQISSLRHVWEHPAFPASGETSEQVNPAKRAAEAWLRNWVTVQSDLPYDFEDVMEALDTGSSGSYPQLVYSYGSFYSSGSDAYGSIPEEFWTNAEIYLGKEFTQRPDYFTCSC